MHTNSKTWLTFHIYSIFLIYSPFNFAPNSISLLSLLYSSLWPPSFHSLPLCEVSECCNLFFSINLLLLLYLSIPSRLWNKVTLSWLSFIFCITYHPLLLPWIYLCYGLFRLLYNSPSLSSLPIFHSSIIIADRPSLIQPFHHLYHLSLVVVVYVCFTLCHAVYWPSLLFWTPLLQLFSLSYLF